ncbi:Uncharacterised protein [Serratia quinivorans]|uniref:hypothetical protein n=1 Tax=Serratia quinivorans TaxID=137545 RepID=UPI000D983492|nr:hypothetical protein [Serratia quinivorans]SPZ66026.1 Uncharacterised protein [Serratia quinivorans]VEI66213.1 Uncharacterised protein [Serratia quinivorans]
MTARQRHAVLYVILSAAAAQALMVLLQLFALPVAPSWIPSGILRVFGIFQQPNLFALVLHSFCVIVG